MEVERSARTDREASALFTGAASVAFFAYLILTIALTWPLATGLAHHIPGDFGDPLFTAWVMAWDATHLGSGWWHANIFAPHPFALAYSEHFLPQGLAALPIYLATGNPILGYNLVFLSTFALSGLGMYLLGRELTGSRAAGFVAGLALAFTPIRIASLPHLQVLSAAWMPFVLYGLRRHFATGGIWPLAGAVAAWILQNLSCGYYFLFFSPVVLFYIVWELTTRGLWRDVRAVLRVAVACAVVVAATVPFLLPYVELRRLGFSPRSLDETKRFSADVYAYFSADPNLRLWGAIANGFPKAEGLLFPGLTILALALMATLPLGRRSSPPTSEGQKWARRSIRVAVAIVALLVVGLLLGYSIRLPGLKITDLRRVLVIAAVASGILLATSRDARASLVLWASSPVAFFSLMTIFAIAMSFGPEVRAKGRVVADTGIYAAFYTFVPGFDGVRVPARYAMIAALGLAALAAFAVASLERRRKWLPAVAGALILLEATAVPIPIDQNATEYNQPGLAALPASIAVGAAVPEVYRYIGRLPASAVVLELPLGEPAFDVRYMFYSTSHWRPLVNGYSGGAPAEYGFLTEALKDAVTNPERAWQQLTASAATHVVVHEGSYAGDRGLRLSEWLRTKGAADVGTFASDRVFVLP